MQPSERENILNSCKHNTIDSAVSCLLHIYPMLQHSNPEVARRLSADMIHSIRLFLLITTFYCIDITDLNSSYAKHCNTLPIYHNWYEALKENDSYRFYNKDLLSSYSNLVSLSKLLFIRKYGLQWSHYYSLASKAVWHLKPLSFYSDNNESSHPFILNTKNNIFLKILCKFTKGLKKFLNIMFPLRPITLLNYDLRELSSKLDKKFRSLSRILNTPGNHNIYISLEDMFVVGHQVFLFSIESYIKFTGMKIPIFLDYLPELVPFFAYSYSLHTENTAISRLTYEHLLDYGPKEFYRIVNNRLSTSFLIPDFKNTFLYSKYFDSHSEIFYQNIEKIPYLRSYLNENLLSINQQVNDLNVCDIRFKSYLSENGFNDYVMLTIRTNKFYGDDVVEQNHRNVDLFAYIDLILLFAKANIAVVVVGVDMNEVSIPCNSPNLLYATNFSANHCLNKDLFIYKIAKNSLFHLGCHSGISNFIHSLGVDTLYINMCSVFHDLASPNENCMYLLKNFYYRNHIVSDYFYLKHFPFVDHHEFQDNKLTVASNTSIQIISSVYCFLNHLGFASTNTSCKKLCSIIMRFDLYMYHMQVIFNSTLLIKR